MATLNKKTPSPQFPSPWVRFRLGVIFIGIVAYFTFVGFRLVQLQLWSSDQLTHLAQKQFRRVENKFPFRLPIYDRNKEELAISIPSSSIFAHPTQVRNKREASRLIAKYLGGSPSRWFEKLKTKRPFIWIQRQANAETAKKLAAHRLPGIYVQPENKRTYPNGELAAPVLGFTDIDGNGLAGVERALNDVLLNHGETLHVSRDGKGNPSYIDKDYVARGENQEGIYLTLDRRLQHAVEEELEEATKKFNAKSAIAIVMDPNNGEVFAMAQRPGFDPNHPNQFPVGSLTNRVISHLYEPGSTMKTLFAAEAIQQGLMKPSTPIDCEGGKMQFGKKTISEAEVSHSHNIIPLEKVIQFSSNIGAVKVVQALGVEHTRTTLDKFGLTQRTGISLPGEAASGPKGDNFWLPIFLATVGFGQGVSVTPLQMVTAYAAFANGGYLVRPKILLSEVYSGESPEVRRVLSPTTVQMVRDMLVAATEGKGGTGYPAKIPGITVAGKTGTAQKYEAGSGYEGKKYVASFIGFLPADRPELVIGVMVDEPTPLYYGTQVAAPLFKRIAERALTILDRQVKIVAAKPAKSETPRKAVAASRTNPPRLDPIGESQWVIPDLQGLTLREAIQLFGGYFGNVRYLGEGFVQDQSPKAGSVIESQTKITLKFAPVS